LGTVEGRNLREFISEIKQIQISTVAGSDDKCPSMLAAHNMITINIIYNIMTEKKNKKEKKIYIK